MNSKGGIFSVIFKSKILTWQPEKKKQLLILVPMMFSTNLTWPPSYSFPTKTTQIHSYQSKCTLTINIIYEGLPFFFLNFSCNYLIVFYFVVLNVVFFIDTTSSFGGATCMQGLHLPNRWIDKVLH